MSQLLQTIIASKRQQADALDEEAAAIAALPADQQSTNLKVKRLAAIESARQMREWANFAEANAEAPK